MHHFRRHNQSTVGGCHGIHAFALCQRLRQLHDHCVRQVLADGLQKRGRGHQNGHRALQRGHSCTVHGEVSVTTKALHYEVRGPALT